MDFVSKYGFWVAIAAACVLALALHFVFVAPMAGKNAKLLEDLERRLKKLEGFARKKDDLKNDRWIEQEKGLAKKWGQRGDKCRGFFNDQPDVPDVFRKKDGASMLSASRWTSEFRTRASKLLKELVTKGIGVGDTAFEFQKQMEEYRVRFPRVDEMKRVTRSFHVQQEFATILSQPSIKLAGISKVRAGPGAEEFTGPLPVVEQPGLFKTQPYHVFVHLEFARCQHLLRELLASKQLKLSVERFAVQRPMEAQRTGTNIVEVRVSGRYMDFSPEARKGEGGEERQE